MKFNGIQKVLKTYRADLIKPQANWPHEVKKVVEFIHANLFKEKLTIANLKEVCHLNGKSFASRFKLYIGFYPKEYILFHRVEASKLLLVIEEVSIVLSGLSVGFSSHSAYCKTFKVKTGCSPNEWIKEAAGK